MRITGGFETSGDPFAAVAGDFDGQGISLGVLQWNIGQGSLQPLAKAAGETTVAAHMPRYGEAFWQAVHAAIPRALAIVRGWQTKGRLREDAAAELASLAGAPKMRAQQIAAAAHIAERAYAEAALWANGRGHGAPLRKEFFWFFDLLVQNGGLKGLRLSDVRGFLAQWGESCADDAVCDWLVARGKPQFGYRDCRRNADLWRDRIGPSELDLFVLSYLRAMKSAPPSRGIVLNRKGTLAAGHGWVNGKTYDFARLD